MASTPASKPSSIASSNGSATDNKSINLNNKDAVKNGGGDSRGTGTSTPGNGGGNNLTVPSPAADGAMPGTNGGRLDTARSSPQKQHQSQKSTSHNNHHASVMSLHPNNLPSTRLSAPGSSATSAISSRETSPVRRSHFQSMNSTPTSRAASRSRKGSQEFSPSRRSSSSGPNYTSIPSPAAVQNALKNKPNLHPTAVDPPTDAKPDKQAMSRRGDTSPLSPRLKSPPPPLASSQNNSLPSISSPQRAEQEPSHRPNISSKRSNGPSLDPNRHPSSAGYDIDDAPVPSGMRTPIRGASNGGSTLETVQEGSLPSTPATEKSTKTITNLDEARLEKVDENEAAPSIKSTTESGSDSGGKSNKSVGGKAEEKSNKKIKPGDILSKQSYTSLNTGRGKPGDGSVRNMIVETETVSSIPQVSLGGGANERSAARGEAGGSVRLKPSNETIRPKKEKKKQTRKPTNLATGTVSSKADIFEAKVASAVDEANSSDSDETFVYESNPTDPHHPARPHRYHSRTPSATSMVSQMDQFGGRSRNAGHNVVGKRSMRFAGPFYNNGYEGDAGEQGSGRGSRANGNGNPSRHNLGRHLRDADYSSNIFDSDSLPVSQQVKTPRHYFGNGSRHSRSGSPRSFPNYRTVSSPKKNGDAYGFDYDAEGADDERTPLVGSIRRNGRRNNPSLRQMEYIEEHKRWRFPRHAGCVFLMVLLLIAVGSITSFIVTLTKPLFDVYIEEIQNVLASEQEIMLDLNVHATNPNLFALTVGDMDVNIFAKSRYVGSEQFWRDGPHPETFPRVAREKRWASIGERGDDDDVQVKGGVDKGTDPIPEDPAGDPQTMLLGRIFEFDSPLTFEPSPWTSVETSSVGQVRLSKPGNKTEEGGTERWERVLQHPFDLIVRGVIKYQLPLSSKFRSASISSSVRFVPDDGDDDAGSGDGDDGDGDGDDDGGSGRKNDTVRIKPIWSKRSVKLDVNAVSEDDEPEQHTRRRSASRSFVA
ncbi:hypothetical protein FQN54_000848 [Arachnomyces sp. PD_36]|nr:hypothetical protein FQN54_000848 [Arachnomyces sp. PD_36]